MSLARMVLNVHHIIICIFVKILEIKTPSHVMRVKRNERFRFLIAWKWQESFVFLFVIRVLCLLSLYRQGSQNVILFK